MSYARLRSQLLAARDAREALIGSLQAETATVLVFVSTAIPGPEKHPPGAQALLDWSLARLQERIDDCYLLMAGCDVLGPYAVFAVNKQAAAAKYVCVGIENEHLAARLLDLDVYAANSARLGRAEAGESARPCLVCSEPAFDCIRINRHSLEILLERVDTLLKPFALITAC